MRRRENTGRMLALVTLGLLAACAPWVAGDRLPTPGVDATPPGVTETSTLPPTPLPAPTETAAAFEPWPAVQLIDYSELPEGFEDENELAANLDNLEGHVANIKAFYPEVESKTKDFTFYGLLVNEVREDEQGEKTNVTVDGLVLAYDRQEGAAYVCSRRVLNEDTGKYEMIPYYGKLTHQELTNDKGEAAGYELGFTYQYKESEDQELKERYLPLMRQNDLNTPQIEVYRQDGTTVQTPGSIKLEILDEQTREIGVAMGAKTLNLRMVEKPQMPEIPENIVLVIGNAVPEQDENGTWVLRDATGEARFQVVEDESGAMRWEGIRMGEKEVTSPITGVTYTLERSPLNLMGLNKEGIGMLDYAWWLMLTGNDPNEYTPDKVTDEMLREYFATHKTVDDFKYMRRSYDPKIDGKPQETAQDVEVEEVGVLVDTSSLRLRLWIYDEEGAPMGGVVTEGVDQDDMGGYRIGVDRVDGLGYIVLNIVGISYGDKPFFILSDTPEKRKNFIKITDQWTLFVPGHDRFLIESRGYDERGYVGGRASYYLNNDGANLHTTYSIGLGESRFGDVLDFEMVKPVE